MTDPMDTLKQFQLALDRRLIETEPGVVHRDLTVHIDVPAQNVFRFTYAKLLSGKAQAVVALVNADPVGEIPCFHFGWATRESARGKGLATEMVKKATEEFCAYMRSKDVNLFYLEAIVAKTNVASQKIAAKLLSDSPADVVDELCGEPAYQYLKLVELI